MLTRSTRAATLVLFVALILAVTPLLAFARQQTPSAPGQAELTRAQEDSARDASKADGHGPHPLHEIDDAMVRLPLAALLGAALALRPKRRGTPPRQPPVIQTQIILAVVGAVIMLVVGVSLARAFGIVGAANLIRYRSKIDDPKDAVVMLAALAVGLASGVGLYSLSVFSTVFIVAALWVIESFEPRGLKHFDLTVKAGNDTAALRPKIEAVLSRFKLEFELRTTSDEEVCYDVRVPLEIQTDRVSNAILKLDPEGHAAVEWAEKKAKTK